MALVKKSDSKISYIFGDIKTKRQYTCNVFCNRFLEIAFNCCEVSLSVQFLSFGIYDRFCYIQYHA